MAVKNLDSLPPLLRSKALHKRLPRNRKLPVVGIAFTVLLHVVVVGAIYLKSDKAPDSIFFLKLLPLQEPGATGTDPAAAPAAPSGDTAG